MRSDWDALKRAPTTPTTSGRGFHATVARNFIFSDTTPSPPPFLDLFILLDLRLRDLDLRILKELGGLGLLLAEAAEKRDGVAEHGVVGAGVLHGAVEFAFDAWYGLEKELAEVAEGGGGLVGDALFG